MKTRGIKMKTELKLDNETYLEQQAVMVHASRIASKECESMTDNGICGFASIEFTDIENDFVKFLELNKAGTFSRDKKTYSVFVAQYNQSYVKNKLFAEIFTDELNKDDIECHVESWID